MSRTEFDPVLAPLADDDPKTVSGYRLAGRLGSGGMGRVFLSHTPAGRPVALKLIRPELGEDASFRRRFHHEVRAAKRVQGLHTAPVIDSDTTCATPWLATAYVPGPSLADTVPRHGALPLPTVLLLVAGVAEALQAIHDAGVVHRDLKPSNVLLAPDGPRVIDFGIARAADATSLTGSGLMIGTPSFMAPEQATGGSISAAADLFALGQVAVYAATGGSAFGEGTSHAVLYRIVHQAPELDALTAELRELVTWCLAKNPAERPSVTEVIQACREASPGGELRRSYGWLPGPLEAEFSQRDAAATPPPEPPAPPPAPPVVAEATPVAASAEPATPQPATAPRPDQRPARQRQLALAVTAGALLTATAVGAYLLGASVGSSNSEDLTGGTDHAGHSSPTPDEEETRDGVADGAEGSPSAPESQPSSPPPASYPGIRLTNSYHLYLGRESVAPRPSGTQTKDEIDFRYLNDQLRTRTGNRMALLPGSREGSLAACRAETRFSLAVPVAKVDEGSQICLRTADGHMALVNIRGFSDESGPSDHLELDLTVWRGAVDE